MYLFYLALTLLGSTHLPQVHTLPPLNPPFPARPHLRRSLTRLRTRPRSRPVTLFALVRDEWYWWVDPLRNLNISYARLL